jgi:capsular polysaccharide biosynthesis protein
VTALAGPGGGGAELASASQLIRRVLATLRRRWLVAAALCALTVAGALAVTLGKPAEYSATAQILLQPSDVVGQLVNPDVLPSPANAQRDVDTNTKLITSHPVLDLVRAQLRSRASDDELVAKIEVSGQTESSLVSITATDASFATARRLASAVARQYARFRRASAEDAVRQAIAAGRDRLDSLRQAGAPADQLTALSARLAELETNAAVTTGGVQIVHLPGSAAAELTATAPTLADAAARAAQAPRAVVPSDNLTPRRLAFTVLVAGLLGAMLGLAGALAIERIDRRLLSVDDVETAFGAPVLGCLPAPGRPPDRAGARRRLRDPRRLRSRAGDQSLVDAYADVTASLGFTGADGPRTLMISPVGRGLNGSRFAARIATQLAALRRRVMVVDANLATIPDDGDPGCGGLTNVLAGDSTLVDEIAVVHVVPPPAALQPGKSGDVISYELLPAGEPVGNPAALLGRPVLAAIMRDARSRADVVLVNAGSPVPVSQSAPIATVSDRIVLLAQLRRTTRPDAVAARRTLGPLYDRVAGVVVLMSDRPSRLRREPRVPAIAPPVVEPPRMPVASTNGAHKTNGAWPPAGAGRERV